MKPQQEHKWKNDCLLQSLSDIANYSGAPIGSEKNTDEVMKHTNAYFSVLSGKIFIFQTKVLVKVSHNSFFLLLDVQYLLVLS